MCIHPVIYAMQISINYMHTERNKNIIVLLLLAAGDNQQVRKDALIPTFTLKEVGRAFSI